MGKRKGSTTGSTIVFIGLLIFFLMAYPLVTRQNIDWKGKLVEFKDKAVVKTENVEPITEHKITPGEMYMTIYISDGNFKTYEKTYIYILGDTSGRTAVSRDDGSTYYVYDSTKDKSYLVPWREPDWETSKRAVYLEALKTNIPQGIKFKTNIYEMTPTPGVAEEPKKMFVYCDERLEVK